MRPLGLLVLCLCCSAAVAQQVTPVQLPPGAKVRDALYADIDGDGKRDLVVAATEPARTLRIYLHPFKPKPDYVLDPVWQDVVAFAVGDVHPDAGSEIVLLSPKGAWVWRPRAGEKERARKLFDCAFLWQLPSAGVVAWQDAVRDIDGDGLVDMIVPEPDGYRIAMQRKPGEFAPSRLLVVPSGPGEQAAPALSVNKRSRRLKEQWELRLTVGGGDGAEAERQDAPLVEVNDALPAPQFRDWDGDGDLDLLVRTERWLFVWRQDAAGEFGARPHVSLDVPVRADRDRRLEVSYSAHVDDLDNDGRTDCVIFGGDQRSKDVRTQVQFFLRARRGKPKELFQDGLPDQLLVLAGFVGDPRLDDVDGDGYRDLVVGVVRPDLLDSLAGSSSEIDADIYVFLNRKGTFSRRPDISFRTAIEARGLRLRRHKVVARFFADVTGDGVRDLLLRDSLERLRVHMTRRTRDGLQVIEKPLWELSIDRDARVQEYGKDVLVLEGEQVLVVRFP